MKNLLTVLIVQTMLLVVSLSHTTAQSAWTLQDCIDHALEHNLDLRRQQLQTDRAGHDVRYSYMQTLPGMNAGTTMGYSFGRSIDAVTNEFFTERIASQRMSASANMTLFAGFSTINNIRYTLARHTALHLDAEKTKNDLILTIAGAYLQILYFEDMLEVARQQFELAEEQLERARILYEGGTISRGRLLDMEAMVAEEEVRLTNANNNLDLSYLEMIYLLELDPEEEFLVVRPEEMDVEGLPPIYEPGHILEKALNVEPAVRAAQKRITMAEKGLSITRGQQLPTVVLGTSLGTAYSEAFTQAVGNNQANTMLDQVAVRHPDLNKRDENDAIAWEVVPYREQLRENYFRSIQVSINIPVFNQWNRRNRIQHARIDVEQARLQYERTKNNLGRVIHQAHADALAAYKDYLSNTKALEAARESFNYSEQGFTLGLVSSLELNESRIRLNRAEVSALQSMYEFVFKMKVLEFYQGEGFVL